MDYLRLPAGGGHAAPNLRRRPDEAGRPGLRFWEWNHVCAADHVVCPLSVPMLTLPAEVHLLSSKIKVLSTSKATWIEGSTTFVQRPCRQGHTSSFKAMSSYESPSQGANLLASSVKLPCGRSVPNRLVKAPMAELQGPLGGGPLGDKELSIYREWAKGGWGMIITGNIAIDETHLGTPWDVSFKRSVSSHDMQQFKKYASACKRAETGGPLAVVQLVHAGRQSVRGSGRSVLAPALAPSAIPMATAKGALPGPIATAFDWLVWGPVRTMTTAEVQELIKRFVDAALISQEVGFDGVELHGSHGYSLAAFLSPKTNQRTDRYGGSARNRFRIVEEIIRGIRGRVPEDFIVGIKLNSADYVLGGLTEDDALLNVEWLAEMGGCDFVEISGGNYENPSFMMHNFNADEEVTKLAAPGDGNAAASPPVRESTRKREAFFADFASRAATVLPETPKGAAPMALMITGGLRSRVGCVQAIEQSCVALCGIGRASVLDFRLPLRFLDAAVPDDDPKLRIASPAVTEKPPGLMSLLPLKLAGAGWTTLYHATQMARVANGKDPDVGAGSVELLLGLFWPRWLTNQRVFSLVALTAAVMFLVFRLPSN